jgi:hypothetical protein
MKYFIVTLFIICLILSHFALSQTPANDECPGATVIPALPDSFFQNTRLATPNLTDPPLLCAENGGGKTVWFKFTADSNGYVRFSTAGSTPADYDVALGLFKGNCSNLVQLDCNDDITPGTYRQAEILYWVQKDSTYILHVAEWKGGGPQGGVPTGGDLQLRVFWSAPTPIVKGPKSGSVAHGVIVSTEALSLAYAIIPTQPEKIDNEPDVPLLPAPLDVKEPKGPPGSNYIEEKTIPTTITSRPVILKNFSGFGFTAWPPDPIVAVGPNHIIAVVNSSFRIFDKNGNLLKSINMSSWFASTGVDPGFSDPQVLYDHYANRWIMAGGDFSEPYNILLSVSDDDNPLGTWYNWALPATLGDSVTGNMPDYPQMGYDENAIYITTREFGTSSFYSRLRIIPKAQLYTNTPSPVVWKDFWDFREPDHRTVPLDGIRPSIIYGAPGVHFLVNASPYSPGTFFTVWKINNPIANPTITATNISVVQYSSASNPGQLGGSTRIEGGGSAIRHKPIYRDSSLYITHPIASGTGDAYSAVHYVRLNPFASNDLEDVAMGLDGYWHFYPAIMVDADHNVMIAYSRSGNSEYAGGYLCGRLNSEPGVLSPSIPLKVGSAYYDMTTPSYPRDRWGDYVGIGLDPLDSTTFWVQGMYATGLIEQETWIGKTKMGPLPGAYIAADKGFLSFRETEVGQPSDTLKFTLTNNGLDTLIISSIDEPDSHFVLINKPTLPLKLAMFDTYEFDVVCIPARHGDLSRQFVIHSNDLNNPAYPINVSGKGFFISPVPTGVLYAAMKNGDISEINLKNGLVSRVGSSGYGSIVAIRVNPTTHLLYGLVPSLFTSLVKINSEGGDAYPVSTIPKQWLKGIAFRLDTLYVGHPSGAIYRVNILSGEMTLVVSTSINISGLDFNPISGELWASGTKGSATDWVYKINLSSGTTTAIGSTGFGTKVTDIVFDASGKLFGVVNYFGMPSDIIVIDTVTGKGAKVWATGVSGIQSLAMDRSTNVEISLYTYNLTPNWNIIALPITTSNNSVSALFPSASSDAFSYVNGKYQSEPIMKEGVGYWLKCNDTTRVLIAGNPRLEDTIDVSPEWNMIGTLSQTIPTAHVSELGTSIQSNIFGYKDSYYITDSLKPGEGYWVKVNQSGKLILSVNQILVASNKNRNKSTQFSDYPPPPPNSRQNNLLIPSSYALENAYPNPFNPITIINYQLPRNSRVTLKVYNILGKEVVTLINGMQDAGYRSVQWNATNYPSGVYTYRLSADGEGNSFTAIKKVLLLK